MQELVVSVDNTEQCQALLDFLRECGIRPRSLDERSVALDLDEEGCPALATLVADLEAWRGRARVPRPCCGWAGSCASCGARADDPVVLIGRMAAGR
jgi:hypothetical protein